MNLPLFTRPYTEVDWPRVLSIGQGTAQDVILQDLLRAQGSYLNGWRNWRGDWRARISELRRSPLDVNPGMGIPILDRRDSLTRNQNEYALPKDFIHEYYERKLGRKSA